MAPGEMPVPRWVRSAASTRTRATIAPSSASEAIHRAGWRIRQGSRLRTLPGSVCRTVVTSPVACPVREASTASTSSRSPAMLAASG